MAMRLLQTIAPHAIALPQRVWSTLDHFVLVTSIDDPDDFLRS